MLETSRAAEFEPLKNATGSSSPESVRRRLSDAAADLLEAAGAVVTRRTDGSAAVPIELSPLIAADPAALRERVPAGHGHRPAVHHLVTLSAPIAHPRRDHLRA